MVLVVKNSFANAGDIRDASSIPGWGRYPWRRAWQPTPVFLPGESHRQRSLAGYSLWGRKESDTTKQLLRVPVELDSALVWVPPEVHPVAGVHV